MMRRNPFDIDEHLVRLREDDGHVQGGVAMAPGHVVSGDDVVEHS